MTPVRGGGQVPPSSRRLKLLRRLAVGTALPDKAALPEVVARMNFVQYDPIRRPAPAQDLILRQRVRRYRGGDLQRCYRALELNEGYFHVYGAMTRELSAILNPGAGSCTAEPPAGLTAQVLALVAELGAAHPRDVAAVLGRRSTLNDWGGRSATTTRALEQLHASGLLRVVRRDTGVKVYELAAERGGLLNDHERLRRATIALASILMPISRQSLRETLAQLRRATGLGDDGASLNSLLATGELRADSFDGVEYLSTVEAGPPSAAAGSRVRLLAPFDPLVWDRRRFEQLWGWPFRFEAYVPASRRRFGYYALPMLVGDVAAGWATCELQPEGLAVSVQFAGSVRRGAAFRGSLEHEIDGLAQAVGTKVRSIEV